MRKDYRGLQGANSIKNPELDKFKVELFDFVKGNFQPSFQNDNLTDYTFYIDKAEWVFRYDAELKCWVLIVENEFVLNKYETESEFYINGRGCLEKLSRSFLNEDILSRWRNDFESIKNLLLNVRREQEQGIRKIDYPKDSREGIISRKDYNSGVDKNNPQHYWSLYFSKDDIKYIDKEPTIAPLTLREYFRLCRVFYLSNPEIFQNVPEDPKEAYIKFADGRTENLEMVELDDPQDLLDWKNEKGRWEKRRSGGHPYEIYGRTYLGLSYTDGYCGYYTWRGFIWNYYEAVTFCREPNVMLFNSEYIIKIINEEDIMQVIPSITPHGYPNENYSEPVRYEALTRKQKLKVVWDELEEAQYK